MGGGCWIVPCKSAPAFPVGWSGRRRKLCKCTRSAGLVGRKLGVVRIVRGSVAVTGGV